MRPPLLQLALILVVSVGTSAGIYRPSRLHRIVYTLLDSRHPDCPPSDDNAVPLSVDGSLKLTTSTSENSIGYKLCSNPVVPFGELIRDSRGIKFWFLRLRVTRLSAGQKLVVVALDKPAMDSYVMDPDRYHEVSSTTLAFPAELQLRYRYARLFWTDSNPPGPQVNITVSRYALFSDSLNSTSRRYLCERFGHVWCQKQQQQQQPNSLKGVCIAPGSCSFQSDCFDRFEEPNKCPYGPLWTGGGGGNRSTLSHYGNGWGGSGGGGGSGGNSWLSRNFPWLAFGAVPIALAFALAKICSQKRELDIDDDYDYKLSYSDHRPGDRQSDDEDDEDDEFDSWRLGERPRRRQQQQQQQTAGGAPSPAQATPVSLPANQQSPVRPDPVPQTDVSKKREVDDESPPPPPPRLWDRSSIRSRPTTSYGEPETDFGHPTMLLLGQGDTTAAEAAAESVELDDIVQSTDPACV